jgi:hypothetical protein
MKFLNVRLFTISLVCIFLTAFVAPIPANSAVEERFLFTQKRDLILLEQLTPKDPVPIDIHDSYDDGNCTTKIHVTGVGIMNEEDMHLNVVIDTKKYDHKSVLVSHDVGNYSTIISQYAQLRAFILEDEKNQHSLADDWGEFDTYDWRNYLFVSAPGNDKTWVKYDHLDNYYTYYPELWNLNWYKYDSSSKTRMQHWSKGDVQYAIEYAYLGTLLGAWATIIGIALGALVGLILTILAALMITVMWFLLTLIESENLDGFGYLCGPGDWPYNGWWWVSFGWWRDVWWPIVT